MNSNICYSSTSVAGFPYAPSEDFASYYTEAAPVAPAPYAQETYPVRNMGYMQEAPAYSYNEMPQQGYCAKREASSEEGGDLADADDDLLTTQEVELDDGVVPPAMLSLPFSVMKVYSKEVDEDSEPAEKKKKKKKKKKKQKAVEEKPDPRLDMNYWLQAPSAAECCIVPIDEDPLPYELLASM